MRRFPWTKCENKIMLATTQHTTQHNNKSKNKINLINNKSNNDKTLNVNSKNMCKNYFNICVWVCIAC